MSTTLRPSPDSTDDGLLTSAPGSLLHELFEARATETPDAVAVWCRGVATTYDALDRSANRLARRLRASGVVRGDHVGLLLPRSAEVYVALLAVLKAGAAYVPLDPDYPADRVPYILEDCQAPVLITADELADRRAGYPGQVFRLEPGAAAVEGEDAGPIPREETGTAPSDLCYVIYTSGTTGRPKGVQVEHRSACHLVNAEAELFRVGREDRVFQGFSIAFDASVEEIWLALASGAALVVGTREMLRSGPSLAGMLTEAGASVFSTVPTLLALMEGDLPGVRLLILGGEQCPADLVRRWCRPGRRMVNTYGPTEATVIATYADLEVGRPVTIGRPVPGYSIHLLGEGLRPVPEGEPGEICIGGPGVARGYLGRPDLTREKFISDPFAAPADASARLYRSGDLGRLNADGEIEFLGRIDSQVKLRGYRIELSGIEAVLIESPGVLACAVDLRDDAAGLPQLVAYVVPLDKARLDPRAVLSPLRARLPAYMVPTRVEAIDALPTLSSGKVDRRSLAALKPLNPVVGTSFETAGRTTTERKIAAAWASVFAAPTAVGLDDDFFQDLGGHSLLAARVVSDLRSDPDLSDLSVLDVYHHPTVASLAAKLEADRADRAAAEPDETRRPFYQASNLNHLVCGLAQAVALYFVVGLFSLQWLTPYLTYTWMIEHNATILAALVVSLSTLLAVYPTLLAASVVTKWAVVGRFRAGEYPLWGVYYFRWWLVQAVQKIVPISYMAGTPLLSWYYRLMGARIGPNVFLGSGTLAAFDLITIGADTCVGYDTEISGYTIEGGYLKLAPVTIGRGCFVGNRAVVGEGSSLGDGAGLEDLSLLPGGASVPANERWAGSPSARVAPVTTHAADRPGLVRRFLFGTAQLLGQFVFPLMVIGAIFPGIIVLNELNIPLVSIYFVVSPLVAVSFVVLLCLEIAAVKWLLIGRVAAGRYEVFGGFYLRKWFVDQLMELSLDVVGPLYATVYLAPWYRLLGAKLGRRAEVSTASFLSPDLLTVDDEGFIADAVSLGAARVEAGTITVGRVRVGRRAFVGNSALLPPGAEVAENGLIGCLSTVPGGGPGNSATVAGSAWLGSPAVFLPQRQESTAFDDERTFHPTRSLRLQRAAIEFFRVTLPSTLFLILTSVLLTWSVRLHDWGVSTVALAALFPLLYAGVGLTAALIVVAFKWALMGRYRPAESPLWSAFVWRSELVTSMYENLARPFLVDRFEGTPFLPWYLRLLGAKVGRRVLLNSSEMTEFDLVEVGDDVALNEECTIQTHLFEDRVMKMSTVRVGRCCSVGSQAVVLYDTEMREGSTLNSLSLLMKGEVLPPWTRWEGSPARSRRGSPRP